VKPNRNIGVQGLRNVLADERLFLPTVDTTIDLLESLTEDYALLAHGVRRYVAREFATVLVQPSWRQAVHRSDPVSVNEASSRSFPSVYRLTA
jgi:hypothetical protein